MRLPGLGVGEGDRVATLAWNSWRHLELYYGVTCAGRVLHTVNPRLFAEQLVYIISHAENGYVFFDPDFASLVEQLAPHLPLVRGWIALCEEKDMPAVKVGNLLCYETLLAQASPDYAWPRLDENTACTLCYTSGTTGNPKGVLYSHRSTILHAFAACAADGLALSAKDSILVIVPLFHANAWSLPFSAAMCGAKLVLPGPQARPGKHLFAAGAGGLHQGRRHPDDLAQLPRLYREQPRPARPVEAETEARLQRRHRRAASDDREIPRPARRVRAACLGHDGNQPDRHARFAARQARRRDPRPRRSTCRSSRDARFFGVELRLAGENGEAVPHDGKSVGQLQVRGNWVISGYFKNEGGKVVSDDGWFGTGDVATINPDGYVQLTDRLKDVIKSGGEWISSIEIENLAVSHPDVFEAAVIAIPHPKWQERPLLLVHPRPGADPTREAILEFLSTRIAKWWVPDDVVFVESLPHTATGKLLKTELRARYGGQFAVSG